MTDYTTKTFSLRTHSSAQSGAQTENYGELTVSHQSDFKVGDVVQMRKEEAGKHAVSFLLKVSYVGDVEQQITRRGDYSVSVVDTLLNNKYFNFKTYDNVVLEKVEPLPVDLVVLTCKDTYISRSDMWRLMQQLVDTCVHLDKRICYLNLTKLQITVSEIWAEGETPTCGYIGSNTRVCFRSTTAVVHLFLQMSTEMWQYDSYGDLYFEKAVSGFLNELFGYWHEAECCHDVTIVMFSRTFYEAQRIEDFPVDIRECIQTDIHGKFYEDFYRVVIQNERYDDWKNTVMKLKKIFINYKRKVLREDDRVSYPSLPRAYNSSAAQGNFLEVLNMSLNVYEKYYLDRNFDRLGKATMIITAGPGVFEVDNELMSVTKHRTIDSGCSADLICMGEQPLHAVPLFKVHKQKGEYSDGVYRIPKNWLNHSFYTSQSQMRTTSTSQFIPRIKQASKKTAQEIAAEQASQIRHVFTGVEEAGDDSGDTGEDSDYDYDGYDRNVFTNNQRKNRSVTLGAIKKSTGSNRQTYPAEDGTNTSMSSGVAFGNRSSDAFLEKGPFNKESDESSDEDQQQIMAGSADTKTDKFQDLSKPMAASHHLRKKDVDPFAPFAMKQPTSANRRRWMHAFPVDKNGQEIQPHHYNIEDHRMSSSLNRPFLGTGSRMRLVKRASSELRPQRFLSATSFDGALRGSPESLEGSSYQMSPYSYHHSLLDSGGAETFDQNWFLTGKEDLAEFTPMVKTGVDWRSLTTPALLPLTTDYYPSDQHFRKLYNDQVYTVDAPEDSSPACAEFIKELVSTRLALGFQLIKPKKELEIDAPSQSTGLFRQKIANNSTENYKLSIGKVFHQISFLDGTITVKVQKPSNSMKRRRSPISYKYQFRNPDDTEYTVSFTQFAVEQLEEYGWNKMDIYVITRASYDNRDLVQADRMKYWRSRFCLLPASVHVKSVAEQIRQTKNSSDCDKFKEISDDLYQDYNKSFVKFMELVNSVKRARSRRSQKKEVKTLIGEDGSINVNDGNKSDSKRIVESMKDPSLNFSFLDSRVDGRILPPYTFISYEAAFWLKEHYPNLQSIGDAFTLLESLYNDGLIKHLEDDSVPMVCGFYLYCIVPTQGAVQRASTSSSPSPGLESAFDREWIEVSLVTGIVESQQTSVSSPRGSHSNLQRQTSSSVDNLNFPSQHGQRSVSNPHYNADDFKMTDIDSRRVTDLGPKVDQQRIEWTTVKYRSHYHPLCAFDFELDWIVATAGYLYELITSWRRKVNSLNYHLLPIPVDPFALPTEKNSDPLRGPLFVPLDTECLQDLAIADLLQFMKYIIKRFGFIAISYDASGRRELPSTQFIHCSGGFFILIQSPSADKKAGFHWSWNFMMTKQWWSPFSGDEAFQDYMLASFRGVTTNDNGRLLDMKEEWLCTTK